MNETLIRLAITQSELFTGWPAEAIARLIAQADTFLAEPGTCIHRAGDTAHFLYLLVTGSMNLSSDMSSRRDFTAGMHLAGDFHGLGPVVSQTPTIYTAICKEQSMLVRIPGELLRELLRNDGRLSFSIFAALERRRLRVTNLYAAAAVRSTRARIAGILKSFNARSARKAEIRLSQDEIATMLGTRRQVVNRVLREMEAQGAVHVKYGRISINDIEKLEKMLLDSE